MSYKALLIGASEYDAPAIAPLPFVRDDLLRLQSALADRDFAAVEILESPRGITRTAVNARVGGFLRQAAAGDTLLILLSGHGQHFEGADYLIPEDATFAIEPFSDCCVEIGWRKELEDCAAARVLFLVDACREGFEQDGKSPVGVHGWSRRKIAAALQRKVAYVYACSPAQLARYVRPSDTATDGSGRPGDSFSLFSRAVGEVVSGVPHAVDLAEFEDLVQARVEALHLAYGKPGRPQQVQVTTDTAARGFGVLPGPARDVRAHPWIRSVTGHPAWNRTPEGPAREAARAASTALAEQLADAFAQASAALADDPWHDAELALRAQKRMSFLLGQLEQTATLSPTEAALTALLPLVGQALWTHETAQRMAVLADGPASPERDRLADFTRTHPRLVRRLRTLDQNRDPHGDAPRIRWWLFHNWLRQQPELYTGQSLKVLAALAPPPGGENDRPEWVERVLSGEWLSRFVQDQRGTPFAVARTGPVALPEVVAASTGDEHRVRPALVAALAKAAQALAIDPLDLPEIVAEHLGISDHVDLTELLATLRASEWPSSGVGRSLRADCGHPAVEIALREHAGHTDALLRDINRAETLAPLGSLPPFADADLVRLTGGAPGHLAQGIRFQLAEDRVQELLMGESLYGDRKLAIRELYQNALDALRHRDARTRYLVRTGAVRRRAGEWTGTIAFRQGVDPDGRPYIECRDNGIGMGVHELSRTFAQGGTRFVDLPEYIEEHAAWAELDPPIELFPNSRFGIGVLSYFMLADEIEVRTCRMGRDGRPGRLLKVTIAGPGNLFRIDDVEAGEEEDIGTTVRLLPARGAGQMSCVDTLEEVLWVAPYATTAEHGSRRAGWKPGELAETALERFRTNKAGWVGKGPVVVLPSQDPDLWWTADAGVLLADGLYVASGSGTGSPNMPYGVVVNLYGRHQPELRVSRASATSFDIGRVERMAVAAASDVVDGGGSLLDPDWLSRLSGSSLPVADRIAELAERAKLAWPCAHRTTTFDAVGVFAPDELLLPLVTGAFAGTDGRLAAALVRVMPAAVLRWRLPMLHRAALEVPVAACGESALPCARPSDLSLLTDEEHSGVWRNQVREWLRGAGGLSVPYPAASSVRLVVTGAGSLAMVIGWRASRETVSATTILERMESTGHTAGEISERYVRLGYRTEPLRGLEAADRSDRPLLRPLGRPAGWLVPGSDLPAAQIALSAAFAGCPTTTAAERLRDLGFGIPRAYPRRAKWDAEESGLLKSLWSAYDNPPEAGQADVVNVAQLVMTAYQNNWSLRETADLLAETGFTLPPTADLPDEPTDDDRMLLTVEDIVPPTDGPVPPQYVLAAAARTGRTADEVADRLRTLGFRPGSVPGDPVERERLDTAVSRLIRSDLSHLLRSATGEVISWHGTGTDLWSASSHVVDDLAALGRRIAGDPELLSGLSSMEREYLTGWTAADPLDFGPVSPECLYAVAEHVGRTRTELAADLTALGYEIAPPDEEFERDLRAERFLEAALVAPEEPMTAPADCAEISLPALASVAVRRNLTLREAALRATECGLRHEADTWFAPGSGSGLTPAPE